MGSRPSANYCQSLPLGGGSALPRSHSGFVELRSSFHRSPWHGILGSDVSSCLSCTNSSSHYRFATPTTNPGKRIGAPNVFQTVCMVETISKRFVNSSKIMNGASSYSLPLLHLYTPSPHHAPSPPTPPISHLFGSQGGLSISLASSVHRAASFVRRPSLP